MGHERYAVDTEITGDRPSDRLAKRLFERSGIISVHIYGSMVTVELSSDDSGDLDDLDDLVHGLYTYYVPGVVIPGDDELIAPAE